jgi:hypothetical protein
MMATKRKTLWDLIEELQHELRGAPWWRRCRCANLAHFLRHFRAGDNEGCFRVHPKPWQLANVKARLDALERPRVAKVIDPWSRAEPGGATTR